MEDSKLPEISVPATDGRPAYGRENLRRFY